MHLSHHHQHAAMHCAMHQPHAPPKQHAQPCTTHARPSLPSHQRHAPTHAPPMHGPACPATNAMHRPMHHPCTARLASQPKPKFNLHPTYTERHYTILLLHINGVAHKPHKHERQSPFPSKKCFKGEKAQEEERKLTIKKSAFIYYVKKF